MTQSNLESLPESASTRQPASKWAGGDESQRHPESLDALRSRRSMRCEASIPGRTSDFRMYAR